MSFRRIAIERRGITERHPHLRLFALGTNKRMHQRPQPLKRRLVRILQNPAQHLRGLLPLIALQPEQDGGLVGEILVHRANADTGLFRHAGGGETRSAFLGQNLSSCLQNGRHQLG